MFRLPSTRATLGLGLRDRSRSAAALGQGASTMPRMQQAIYKHLVPAHAQEQLAVAGLQRCSESIEEAPDFPSRRLHPVAGRVRPNQRDDGRWD